MTGNGLFCLHGTEVRNVLTDDCGTKWYVAYGTCPNPLTGFYQVWDTGEKTADGLTVLNVDRVLYEKIG